MKQLICIMCPKGCCLSIDEDLNISNNQCIRGKKYAIDELTLPKRMVTSTVKIKSQITNRLPVMTSQEIDKNLVFEVVKKLDEISLTPPIFLHDIIIKNIFNSGVDIIATRTILK